MQLFLISLIKSIIFDLGAKVISWLSMLWKRDESKKINQENADKGQQHIKEGASNEQIADDTEDLLNGVRRK